MGRQIAVEGIALYARVAPCAHGCTYCLLGNKDLARIPFSRIARVIERFIDWSEAREDRGFRVFHWIRHSFECDMATMKRWIDLWARLGHTPDLLLGGLRTRSENEMEKWLEERKGAGIREVHASFAGHGEVHDRWNGRPGDFEFQLRTLRTAGEMGFEISERLLLTESLVPLLDGLVERLEALPGRLKRRYLCPLFYMGFATRLEDDRITKETLRRLPERVVRLCAADPGKWRSEADWIGQILDEDDEPEKVMLRLEPDAGNIDAIERMSCDEIVEDLADRTRRAYEAIPGRKELCETSGDRSDTRIYPVRNDIERKWLDHYLEVHPTSFDRFLTHLSMVQ